MAIEHSSIPDNQRHEPKGASTALENQVLVSNGDGTTQWITQPPQMGWADYNDSGTTTVDLTLADTYYDLTNDEGGSSTTTAFIIPGVDLWDPVNERFDWTSLEVGDTVDIRIDVDATTSGANHNIKVDLEMQTAGVPFYLPFINQTFKTAGTHNIVRFNSIYIGSEAVRTNFAKFVAKSDSTGDSIKINGWYVRAIKRNP